MENDRRADLTKEPDIYDYDTGMLLFSNGGRLHLSLYRKRIFDHLLMIRPRMATAEDLASAVYFDTEGPETERRIVQVLICKMARSLVGSSIKFRRGGMGRGAIASYGLEGEIIIQRRDNTDQCPTCGQRLPEHETE